jgi:hypothetical protein
MTAPDEIIFRESDGGAHRGNGSTGNNAPFVRFKDIYVDRIVCFSRRHNGKFNFSNIVLAANQPFGLFYEQGIERLVVTKKQEILDRKVLRFDMQRVPRFKQNVLRHGRGVVYGIAERVQGGDIDVPDDFSFKITIWLLQ